MADIAKSISIIFQGQDQGAIATASALSKSLEGVAQSTGLTAKQIEQAAAAEAKWSASSLNAKQNSDALAASQDKLGDSTSKTEKSAISLTGAMQALAASMVAKAFIDANVSFEQFDKAMTLITGSSKAAADEFKFITDLTNTLGINVKSASEAYVSLSAATKGTNLEGQATRDIFAAIANAMAVLGKSGADTEGALKAIEQIASKGKVTMEDLRGQLGDRLPGAMKLAAAALGIGVENIDDFIKKGVSAADFLPKLAAEINKTFAPDGIVRVAGYTQEMARLQNAMAQLFVEAGNAGVMDALVKGIQLATVAAIGSVASFKLVGEVLGAFFGAVAAGDFGGFGDAVDLAMNKAADATRNARDALLDFGGSAKAGSVSANALSASLGINDIDQYAKAQTVAAAATDKAAASSKSAVDQLAKQAAETKRAEEAAAKMHLELEKLATDERIALIESRVQLNVAQVEADTKRIEAAFDSINSVIGDTNELMGELFGILANPNLEWAQIRAIEDQIAKENDIKKAQLELQKALIEAQINKLNAEAQQIIKGDALIKIDGAGLQPHLEGFMWEILRTIQLRANRDGRALLLGV